jgi:hypothetical protein
MRVHTVALKQENHGSGEGCLRLLLPQQHAISMIHQSATSAFFHLLLFRIGRTFSAYQFDGVLLSQSLKVLVASSSGISNSFLRY